MKSSWIFVHRFQLLGINQLISGIPATRSHIIASPLKLRHNALCKNQQRSIFTEEFLGVSLVRLKQEQVNKELAQRKLEPVEFQEQILSAIPQHRNHESTEKESRQSPEFQPIVSGSMTSQSPTVTNILSDDVRKLMWLAKTKDQMKTAQFVLRHYVQSIEPHSDAAILRKKSMLFKDFMQVCRLHGWLELAKEIWNDQIFMDRVGYIDVEGKKLATNMPTITLCYLDMMYKKKMYQEIIDEIQKLEETVVIPVFVYVIGMMACLQINTPSSLEAANAFYNGPSGGQIMKVSRVVQPYSLLLFLQDKKSQALETVSLLPSRHFPVLRAGIMVYFLANLDRPEEACALLENVLRNSEREDRSLAIARGQNVPKLIFSIESVKALTKAVETRKDVSLNARLAGIFSRLDKIASITDKNMLNLVTTEIDADGSVKHRRRRQAKYLEDKFSVRDDPTIDDDLLDDNSHR